MSIATYRGIKYDTSKNHTQNQLVEVQETYRGIKHAEQKKKKLYQAQVAFAKRSSCPVR